MCNRLYGNMVCIILLPYAEIGTEESKFTGNWSQEQQSLKPFTLFCKQKMVPEFEDYMLVETAKSKPPQPQNVFYSRFMNDLMFMWYRGGATGGAGGWPPTLKVSKKGKFKNMGYFHALKWAFLTSLIRKYMLWEGFYHNFSTKKASASGGFTPWPPPRGSAPCTPSRGRCPLDPSGNFTLSNDLPWRRPCLNLRIIR